MFLCTLKFNKGMESLAQIINYLREADKNAASQQSHAPHLFELAMTNLVEGRTDEAHEQLTAASEYDQATLNPENMVNYLSTYKNQREFQMWRIYAGRMKRILGSEINDFDSQFTMLINKFPRKPKSLADKSPADQSL
jgi:hypothetical protein